MEITPVSVLIRCYCFKYVKRNHSYIRIKIFVLVEHSVFLAICTRQLIGVVTRLDDMAFESWKVQKIFLFCKTSIPVLELTQPLLNGCCVSFLRVRRPGGVVDHSSPSSNKVKNEWFYTSVPSICLDEMDRSNFIFFTCKLKDRNQT